MSRECPHPRSAANVQCNNCGQTGHFRRDCPEPKDYSKIICHTCGHAGHTASRCTVDPADYAKNDTADIALDGSAPVAEDWMNDGGNAEPAGAGEDWMNGGGDANAGDATNDWMASSSAETATTEGGWTTAAANVGAW